MQRVQCFHYKVIQEKPISALQEESFKTHRRLMVFLHKGTICVTCGKIGTRLILGVDFRGNKHWDVYTDDLYPLTVDHIIPRSKGGSEELSNKQPMCSGCNSAKGNGDAPHKGPSSLPYERLSKKTPCRRGEVIIGRTVIYISSGGSKFNVGKCLSITDEHVTTSKGTFRKKNCAKKLNKNEILKKAYESIIHSTITRNSNP